MYKRDYSNFDESALIQDIQSVDREGVLHANPNPNVIFYSFFARISGIIRGVNQQKKLLLIIIIIIIIISM